MSTRSMSGWRVTLNYEMEAHGLELSDPIKLWQELNRADKLPSCPSIKLDRILEVTRCRSLPLACHLAKIKAAADNPVENTSFSKCNNSLNNSAMANRPIVSLALPLLLASFALIALSADAAASDGLAGEAQRRAGYESFRLKRGYHFFRLRKAAGEICGGLNEVDVAVLSRLAKMAHSGHLNGQDRELLREFVQVLKL
uniref:Phosphagen kinase N-terminal domain-containing protein n=2 Tax=Macrostomum lignano TaxID=282301 RepID=A0A1I8GSC2_9PLAT